MTRWASPANATAAAASSVALVTLVSLAFDGGTIYVHDGFATLVNPVDGQTYSGLGDYGGLDTVEETTETIAKPLTLTLSEVPTGLVSDAMTENVQGRVVTIYVGLLDVNAMTWIANPEVVWEGRMDYITISLGQGKATIELRCENRLNREPLVARYTDQDQQIAFPGDTFFNLLWMIQNASAGWGATSVQYPANVPPNAGARGNGGASPPGGRRPNAP